LSYNSEEAVLKDGDSEVHEKPSGAKKPEITRFKTYYSVPENLPELDGRIEAILYSFYSVAHDAVLERLAILVRAVVDRVERSIYDPYVGCAIYRKACQILSERDIDPWELAEGNAVAEAFHQDAYDGLPGVDEYEPYTSLALIKLLARAVIDARVVADEMLSGSFSTYNRERVTMAGLLGDARFIPYLEGILKSWNYPDPPRHVLSALGQIATPKAVRVLRGWLKGDDETSAAAVEALEHASTKEALEALTDFKATGDYPAILDVAIANVKEGLGGLLKMARSKNPTVRAGAMDRLSGIKEPRAVLTLAEALEDHTPVSSYWGEKDYTVAEIACCALDYYGRAYLRKILSDDVFNEYRKISRRLRYGRKDDGEWRAEG